MAPPALLPAARSQRRSRLPAEAAVVTAMPPHDSPVQVHLVKDWLRVTGEDLAAVEEAARVLRERVEGMATLLLLEAVPPAEIEQLLPAGVGDALRKVLGRRSIGGFLGRRPARTPALPRAAPPPRSVTEIADRLVGPSQRRIWQHLLATSPPDGPPREFSPAQLADELAEHGEQLNTESVRKVLNRLTALGGTQTVRPGRYQLTAAAITYARTLPADVTTPSAAATAQDGHPSTPRTEV
jgi:hypothetical protein